MTKVIRSWSAYKIFLGYLAAVGRCRIELAAATRVDARRSLPGGIAAVLAAGAAVLNLDRPFFRRSGLPGRVSSERGCLDIEGKHVTIQGPSPDLTPASPFAPSTGCHDLQIRSQMLYPLSYERSVLLSRRHSGRPARANLTLAPPAPWLCQFRPLAARAQRG